MMWICERKDIPQKLFFSGTVKKGSLIHGVPHAKNYKFWKDNDIIDMLKFHVVEHIYNKNRRWVEDLNKYTGSKPIFLIINRAFMTTRPSKRTEEILYRYQEINSMPRFVIIDECHSSMANETYQLLLYLKYNREAKIHGLSATSYRSGKSSTNLSIVLDTDQDIETKENEKKLLNIFHKPGNVNKLNILSFFNIKDVIGAGIILEPVFHWYKANKLKEGMKKTKSYSEKEIVSVLCVLNTIIRKCKYRKCIVWCGTIEIAEQWHQIFGDQKKKYNNLS